jgi:hypothetical protein
MLAGSAPPYRVPRLTAGGSAGSKTELLRRLTQFVSPRADDDDDADRALHDHDLRFRHRRTAEVVTLGGAFLDYLIDGKFLVLVRDEAGQDALPGIRVDDGVRKVFVDGQGDVGIVLLEDLSVAVHCPATAQCQ